MNPNRDPFDRFWTPAYVTLALLDREEFPSTIYEPACGEGHITRALRSRGYSVIEGDLLTGQDFFKFNGRVKSIITNPPYIHNNKWLQHVYDCTLTKSAVLVPLTTLTSRSRHKIFESFDCSLKAYMFTSLVMNFTEGEWKRAKFFHTWLVIDKTKPKERVFDWIDISKHEPLDTGHAPPGVVY